MDADNCASKFGRPPNILLVDFIDKGNVFGECLLRSLGCVSLPAVSLFQRLRTGLMELRKMGPSLRCCDAAKVGF